jgi:hypothetical protein
MIYLINKALTASTRSIKWIPPFSYGRQHWYQTTLNQAQLVEPDQR